MNLSITPTVITPPTVDPISLEEAKSHSRIDHDGEDALVKTYIRSARDYVEARLSESIGRQTLEAVQFWDEWGHVISNFPGSSNALFLPRATPLVSVTSVTYFDSDGGVGTVWAASEYLVDTSGYLGSIRPVYGGSYPSFTARPVNPLVIRYVAGNNEASELVRYAMLLLVAAMYENREGFAVADRPSVGGLAIQYGIEAFLAQKQRQYAF